MAFIRRFPIRRSSQFLKKIFAGGLALGCFPLLVYFILLSPSKKPTVLVTTDIIGTVESLNIRASNSPPLGASTNNEVQFKSTSEERRKPKTSVAGMLNVDTWVDLCGMKIDVLRNWPHFPFFPDKRSNISNFHTSQTISNDNGQRIFGFIHPHTNGSYKFAIASDDTSELWLSPNEDPSSSELIARVYSPSGSAWTEEGDYKKYPTQISQEITLQAGKKYFIEAILKQGGGIAHVSVYWACLKLSSEFEVVSSKYLSSFAYSKNSTDLPGNPEELPNHAGKLTENFSQTTSDFYRYHRLPFVKREEYNSSIPSCPYTPSFIVKEKLKQFVGVWQVLGKESRVYPADDTNMYTGFRGWSGPNLVADEKHIEAVVDKFMMSVPSRPRKYVLKRIHQVIQKTDPGNGDRFSLELEVGLENTSQRFRLWEHVYMKKESNSLCLPEGIISNHNATIYIILPIKNQGKWVYHFIKQLSEASLLTGDTNFHVMVIDFESQDINMTKAFNTPLLRSRHTLINMKGKFYKTLAQNKAVELVPSPHDIVFLFDLHIDVPADILDSVRKHTIEGRISYFPIVGRLNCGSYSAEHRGFWQMDGYGLGAVYKSDWTRFGGMNINDFKFSWGGEDWDLVDRVLNSQLEIERVKKPGLFHYFHSKQRKWT